MPAMSAQLPDSVQVRLHEIERLRERNRYEEALPLARALLADCEASYGAQSPPVAAATRLLAAILCATHRPTDPERRAAFEGLLELTRSAFGEASREYALALIAVGEDLKDQGAYDAAREPLLEALAVVEKTGAERTPLLGSACVALAQLEMDVGNYENARDQLRRAAALYEETQPRNDIAVANVYNDLGNALKFLSEYEESRRYYERALLLRREAFGEEHGEVASVLNNLGALCRTMGDYAGARRHYEQSLAMKERTLGPNHPSVARSCTNLANLFYITGDYLEAGTYYERAQRIKESELTPDHPSLIPTLTGLVGVHEALFDFERAGLLSRRILEICEKSLGLSHPLGIQTLANLGLEETLLGHYDAADSILALARAHADTTLDPGHVLVLSIADAVGRLRLEQGRYADAIEAVDSFLRANPDLHELEPPRLAEALGRLSLARACAGDPSGAFTDALESERVSREHFRATAMTLPERQALRYARARTHGLDLILSLVADPSTGVSVTDSWDCLIRSRGLVLDEMAARGRALGLATDAETRALADSLIESKARFANVLMRGPGAEPLEQYRAFLERARQHNEDLERRLAASNFSFRADAALERVGFAEITAALDDDQALVAFVKHTSIDRKRSTVAPVDRKATSAYVAFVLRGGSEPVAIALGPERTIDDAVLAWRESVIEPGARGFTKRPRQGQPRDPTSAGQELRRLVWDPIVPHVGDARRVFLVPDGALNLVNFYALPEPGDRFLVDTNVTLHLLSVERDLLAPHTMSPGTGFLVVGGPEFDAPPAIRRMLGHASSVVENLVRSPSANARPGLPPCEEFETLRFDPLPGTLREAEQVSEDVTIADLGPVTKLVGAKASEAEVKRAMRGQRLVHFATHGFFLESQCPADAGSSVRADATASSAGLTIQKVEDPLERWQRAAISRERATEENPLLLSGLAFAGANRRNEARPGEEDGILTAEEIAALDLSSIEWAVLSACDTGVGEILPGEGVFGMRRAFEIAGVGTTVMSLWPVDDESARDWMSRLYSGRLVHGLDTAAAVKWASRAALEHRRANRESTTPFHWAGFVAAGNWR